MDVLDDLDDLRDANLLQDLAGEPEYAVLR